jgi:hypothetical protein
MPPQLNHAGDTCFTRHFEPQDGKVQIGFCCLRQWHTRVVGQC